MFTPGPWEAYDRTDAEYPYGVRSAESHCHIASVRWEDEEGNTNARLIAQAPALLEALELAVRYLEHPDVTALPFALPVTNVSRMAHKAIKEAK